MSPACIAFAGGALGAAGMVELLAPLVRVRAPRAVGALGELVAAVLAAGREGRDPGTRERRRLLAAGGVVAALCGWTLAGVPAAVALGAGGPGVAARLLAARRAHYRRAVDAEAAAVAVALAGALGGGHSLRAALGEAAHAVPGPAGHELRRVSGELDAGARTDAALEGLRSRVRAPRIDALVACCLVQRHAGGDLAGLLRESAEAFGDQSRLEDEVKAATAQARFTGLVVVLLPLGGAALAELASPGFVAGLLGSFLTAWLVGIAVALQAIAVVAIRRLGRVRW